jgi:hypothetical protein
MRKFIHAAIGAASIAGVFGATYASAEPYVDYTQQKGFWNISAIEVDPNHVDDYLSGLRHSQMPGLEVLKRRGLIDDYRFMVRNGYVKGSPNVLIMTHSPTAGVLDPDQTRDQSVQKEIYSLFSKEQGDRAVSGYEKYRTFIDTADWGTVVINK